MCRYSNHHRAACCHVDRWAIFPAGHSADGQQLDPDEDGWRCPPWFYSKSLRTNLLSLNAVRVWFVGLKETPSQEDWLISVLPENSKVGVDPWIIAAGRLNPRVTIKNNMSRLLYCTATHKLPIVNSILALHNMLGYRLKMISMGLHEHSN